jgi:hypothetical protein
MAANNLDFFNECLEGIGKRKLTDGQADNTYVDRIWICIASIA